MTLLDCLKTALVSLRLNLLRSLLTTLGIIIGVASVIVMASIGGGARQEVERQITSLGSNMLTVVPGAHRGRGRSSGAGTGQPLSEDDIKALLESVPSIEAISGDMSSGVQAVAGAANWSTSVSGVDAAYPEIRDLTIDDGRFFTEDEARSGARVAVLGATVVNELFQGSAPIGSQIRLQNVPFTIIGTLTPKGQSSFGRDQDDVIVAPLKAVRARLAGRDSTTPNNVGVIRTKIFEGEDMARAEADMTDTLHRSHRIRAGQENDFRIYNTADFIRARNETATTLGFLLAATAGISLIVGGIGIMNIMLVSVTERTREIGLRMAVGARPADIRNQFLVEAVVLCLAGGAVGLLFGFGGALAVARVAGWPTLLDPSLIALAIGASAAVGVFFGFFPARQASQLSPIEALRHE